MQLYHAKMFVNFKSIANGHSFDIQTIQSLKQCKAYDDGMAQHDSHFQIVWITNGEGNFWIDLQHGTFQINQLFFLNPSQVYHFQPAGEIDGYIISFTESFLGIENQESDLTYHGSLFQLFNKTNGIQICNELITEINDCAERMIREYNNLHLFRDEMLKRYLKILFIHLSRQFECILQTTRQTRNTELVQRFMSLLDKNYKTEKMVSGYASLLLVTPNYLNEIIKKTTGYSAGYHIRQRIVLEAKRQATYSNTCMKQIGYYLGFNDMAHFSKFFKTATGMNFTDYKKEKMIIAVVS